MNHRSPTAVLSLVIALVATGCGDQPTSPRDGHRPRAVISDADHDGDNKSVFFLPPLVPSPVSSDFFKAGEFNPNLTSAVIRVCHIVNDECATTVASFGAGQATGPIVVSLQDEHYLALWHTDDSDPALVIGEPYRIEVFPDGDLSVAPLAWADVEVVGTGRDLKNVNTQETIGLVDGRTLPIKVRFQNDVRCKSDNCTTERVDNAGGTLVLETGNGALVLQDGWLPPGFSEVTVTLQREPTGPDNDCVGKADYVGPGLVAQREGCLQVTTDPVIPRDVGIQQPAFIFVCSETDESDPLSEFLQIIKADDGVPLQALNDVDDDAIPGFVPACAGTPDVINLESNPLMRLAHRGLRTLGRLLEVKPLYAIDLGQGGEIPIGGFFSYFTLGVQGSGATFGTVPTSATAGTGISLSFQLTGKTQHPPNPIITDGLSGIDVTFTVIDGDGNIGESGEETVETNADGVATVTFIPSAGANEVEAVAIVNGEPVTLPVTFSLTGTAVPVFGGSFVAFTDIDAFNNNRADIGDNMLLVQNLVGFGGTEPRASGSTVVFDHGKNSFCGAAAPHAACAGFSDLKTVVANAGFTVVDVVSTATNTPLASLASTVKVVFLVAPRLAYSAAEISGLKQFAAQGGRIVYLADYCDGSIVYCDGGAVMNALTTALGVGITYAGGAFGSAVEDLPVSILSHQITTGMEDWDTAGAGALSLGTGATPLIIFIEGELATHTLAAVAPVQTSP